MYRAVDSQLKRSVAIKVLPASVGGDVDRLARFQREAETLVAVDGNSREPHFSADGRELIGPVIRTG